MKRVLGWIFNKINNFFKDSYFKIIVIYTIIFFVISMIILGLFTYYNKSFINSIDTFSQHIITLKYFRGLLLDLINNGSFSTFVWNIGFGLDMFANLCYYSFGDLFSYISVLVSEGDLFQLSDFLMIFRMWFIGLSFIYFCRYKKIKGPGVIIGALMYTLSANTFTQGFRNPYMLNASILFPLMMIGVEKVIVDNKHIFFVVIVSLCFLSGFYFAYMQCLIIALYGVFLAIRTYKKKVLKIILVLLKTLLLALISLLIASVLLLPSVMQFLNSSRNSSFTLYQFFDYYYQGSIVSFLSSDQMYDNRIGLSSIFLIALPVFIMNKKKDYPVFFVTIFLIVAMFIPLLSSALVGFSFPLNRWSFMICFFLSYITSLTIKSNFYLDKKDIKNIFLVMGIYFLILFLYEVSFDIQIISSLVVFLLLIFIYSNTSKLNRYFRLSNVLSIIVVSLGVLFNFFNYYSPYFKNGLNSFVSLSNINDIYNNSYNKIDGYSDCIDYLKEYDDSFYMIGKYPNTFQSLNLSLFLDYNSISYYYSINSKYYETLSNDLGNSQYSRSYEISEFDYRTRITTLLGNKYFISKNSNYVPYGYEKIKEIDEVSIYKNKYYLPFGIFYSDYITEEEYDSLTEYEKEIVLLKTTVLEEGEYHFDDYKEVIEEDYSVLDIESFDDEIKVLDISKDYLSLETEKIKNKEIYVKISGLKWDKLSENEMINVNVSNPNAITIDRYRYKTRWDYDGINYTVYVSSNGRSKSEYFRDSLTQPYYYEDDVVYVNLGYFKSFNGKIKIAFSELGNYSFDDIEVIAVNYDSYSKDIKSLSEANFEVLEYSNGYLKGKFNSSKKGILQLSTIYSDGWEVYVDGEKVDTFISNKSFLGINISEGEYILEMKYSTPYLSEGIKLSKIGLMLFSGVILIDFVLFIYKKILKK